MVADLFMNHKFGDLMKAEQLLEKYAKKNMIRWDQESFKRPHTKLHKTIIEAINEALQITV